MALLSVFRGGWEELRALILASFVAVFFPISFKGAAARTGISPSDSKELWLLWEVDASASSSDFSASSASLLELVLFELSPDWCSSSSGVLSSVPAALSSSVPSPSWDADLLYSWSLHWILLVILVQLFGNGCWTLSGSRTLLGWSHEVESWSRIWLVRMWMNVKPLSQWVKLLHWGWLCQSQPCH